MPYDSSEEEGENQEGSQDGDQQGESQEDEEVDEEGNPLPLLVREAYAASKRRQPRKPKIEEVSQQTSQK